jgi:hypothetical protein
MKSETSSKIDEIMFETNDKINAIVYEIREIRFSRMSEEEKQVKYEELRKEFEKIMHLEENRIEDIMKNYSDIF